MAKKNKQSNTSPISSLELRIKWLGLADFDYLSARVLLISGFVTTGSSKAMEAFEKLFKLFIMLHVRISEGRDTTVDELKHNYSHNLTKLFDYIAGIAPFKFDPTYGVYFKALEDAYPRRYPEAWKPFSSNNGTGELDIAYRYFRNLVAGNFPAEELEMARRLGTFMFDGYSPEVHALLRRNGGTPPADAFLLHNLEAAAFDVDHVLIASVGPKG